jgi:FKBP-type peptidyl-prolyl cis-trans isomerase SlyD
MDLRVEDGKLVCLNYTISLADGTVIDSDEQSGTWTYVHGQTRIPSGLAQGIEGLQTGDQVRLELAPEEAFGAADAEAFQNFPKDRFPTAVLYVGYTGELPGPGGSVIPYRIHAIEDESVTLDLNHPLAGKHVIFDVTVVHIQD